MKSGIIYPQGKEVNIGKIVTQLKRTAWSLRWVGVGLIMICLVGLGVIYQPLITAEVNYALRPPVIETPPSKFGSALKPIPGWTVPNLDYSIYIPKIAAKSQVIPGVDASNPDAYLAALKIGVAEAAGLSHPGQMGTTYLFAHSTDSPLNFARFNAVFYLLDKVAVGDQVEVVYNNNLYRYKVTAQEIIAPDDLKFLIPQQDEEKLVLQTCYPPGTTWQRLIIVAKRST